MMLTRRHLVRQLIAASIGAVVTPSLPGTPVFATDHMLHVADLPIEGVADLFYADQRGYFKSAGLDVSIDVLANGQNFIAGVVAGTYDLAPTTIPAIAIAREQGIMIKCVAPQGMYVSATPSALVLVLPDSPLHTARDLNGKTIASSGLNNLPAVALRVWLTKNGADASSVKVVEFPIAAMADALRLGRIDAAIVTEPFITLAKDLRSLGSPYDAIAPRFISSAWFASDTWLATNGDVARSFADAMRKTHVWANGRPKELIPMLQQATKISSDLASTMRLSSWGTELDPNLIQPLLNVAASAGMLPRPISAEDLIWKPGVESQRLRGL